MRETDLRAVSVTKTLMMLLVVLGHACIVFAASAWGGVTPLRQSLPIAYFARFLELTHTQTFFVCSGFFFALQRYEKGKYRTTGYDLKHRAKRLLVPYAVISVFWAAPADYFAKDLAPAQLAKNYLLGFDPAQLWFLLTLFLLYILFYFTSDRVLKLPVWLGILGFLAVRYLGVLLTELRLPLRVLRFDAFLRSALYFYLGLLLQQRRLCIPRARWLPLLLALCAGSFALYAVKCIDSECNAYLKETLMLFVNLSGVFAYLCIGTLLKNLYEKPFFAALSAAGMGIYLLHQQILYATMRLTNFAWIAPLAFVIVNFCAAAAIAWGLSWLLRRTAIGRAALGEAK